ncbi:exported protein of unknown function [Nitrospira japonica]|uniref:Uncharacterized protein n=1 Tax=Nitrospira japonica TaxID=1325564 RepID=A0A1W1I054_9BACT|nr:hypothetical protein [Nitrospira japonica]SLM46364.1 exported protein of unknown function [Nitrospira japonica]
MPSPRPPFQTLHTVARFSSRRRTVRIIALIGLLSCVARSVEAADPPCDRYPPAKQARCADIWKGLNREDGPAIAQFGLEQQRRREAGQLTAEQHLAQNMEFIKRSTERRLERLKERMANE